ncbi:MAG: Ig-like domain-containing protein [Spirochaetota bacterium]
MQKHSIILFLLICTVGGSRLVSWDFPFNPFNSDKKESKKKPLELDLGSYSESKVNPKKISNLEILRVSPKGTIPIYQTSKKITVVFNKAILSLNKYKTAKDPCLQIIPYTSGTFSWSSTRICIFTPASSWKYDQEYRIRIPQTLESLDKKTLSTTYTSSFSLETPEINVSLYSVANPEPKIEPDFQHYEYGYYYDSYERNQDILPYQTFRVNFSQDISKNDLLQRIDIRENGKSVPWQITREPIKNRGFEFRNPPRTGRTLLVSSGTLLSLSIFLCWFCTRSTAFLRCFCVVPGPLVTQCVHCCPFPPPRAHPSRAITRSIAIVNHLLLIRVSVCRICCTASDS